ncbi:MAG: hypothetical protein Q4A07_02520 [Coriobacteriales bacterium]|nr:hypothetical protein [Coriobacteriales bacterium]
MNCPYCGAPLSNESSRCANCGYNIDEQPVQIGVPGAHLPARATTSDQAPVRQGHGLRTVAVVLCILLAAGLATCGFAVGSYLNAVHQPHPVTFMVNISNYDQDSSRIPVRITGTDMDGNKIDQTIFLAHSGVDVELPKGRYQAEVLGSPISSTGIIYHIPTTIINFTLGEDLSPKESYTLPARMAFEFYPIDPSNMTDEQIQDALAWARKDEASGVDVGKLEAAAKSLQQSANNLEGQKPA